MSASLELESVLKDLGALLDRTHPRLPGLQAQIKVNGQAADVYDIRYEGDGKVVGYIEALEGQEVALSFTLTASKLAPVHTAFEITVGADNHHRLATWRFAPKQTSKFPHTYEKGTIRDSATTVRPLTFAPVSVTDDEAKAVQDEHFLASASTFTVDVRRLSKLSKKRVNNQRDSKSSQDTYAYKRIFEKQPVHEKFKPTVLSHQTELGPPRENFWKGRSGSLFKYSSTYLDPKEGAPYVQFEFRYRSRFLLEVGHHLPAHMMPSSNEPAPENTRMVDLTTNDSEESNNDRQDYNAPSDDETESELLRLKKRIAEIEGIRALNQSSASGNSKLFLDMEEEKELVLE
ncbi:hypothetical protein OIV83_004810 [Microbotryomycetes sp. JL201]|nr:hypothetical protein OIV83_004810 [Microbotryomycetes sp. JL201]